MKSELEKEISKEKANLPKVKKALLLGSFLLVVAGVVFHFANGPDPGFFVLLGAFLFVVTVLISLGGQNRIQILELQKRVSELEERLSKKDK